MQSVLIVYIRRGDNSQFIYGHSFHFQQFLFHFNTSLVSSQGKVRPDCPMTGNYDGKGIVGESVSHRPGALWITQMDSYPFVRTVTAPGNPVLSSQNPLLKDGA